MAENIGSSVLQLERMAFKEVHYTRSLETPAAATEYEMNFNREVVAYEDNSHFMVSLTANVWSKGEPSTKLRVTLTGFFRCECEDDAIKQELVQYNTLAILFPYLRSQICLITVQPDIPPITFPPVNIVALFKDVDNREGQQNN